MMMMINMVKMTNFSISMTLTTVCSERSKGNESNCSLAKKETKKTIYGFKWCSYSPSLPLWNPLLHVCGWNRRPVKFDLAIFSRLWSNICRVMLARLCHGCTGRLNRQSFDFCTHCLASRMYRRRSSGLRQFKLRFSCLTFIISLGTFDFMRFYHGCVGRG